ncbi:hypothetical protein GCM10022416_59260 [Actinomadura keratinilytica]|uniref:CHAD domain-containing protein n=1 Tax=Actinomadura keratinilytica TaxID=547461 RepID=A0ABP7ZHE9_9ACTN
MTTGTDPAHHGTGTEPRVDRPVGTGRPDADSLEHWRAVALTQAARLRANSAHIRALIAERDSDEPMRACIRHGERLTRLSNELHEKSIEHDRLDQARAILATALVDLRFLPPKHVETRLTAEAVATWCKQVRDQAARAADGIREPTKPRPPAEPFTPPGEQDDAPTRVEYWKQIAQRQTARLETYPRRVAELEAELHADYLRRASCEYHRQELDHLGGLLTRIGHQLDTARRAYRFLDAAFDDLHERALRQEVVLTPGTELPRWAERIGDRAHRIWQR